MLNVREGATARTIRCGDSDERHNGGFELPISDFLPDRLGLAASRVVRAAEKRCLMPHGIGLAEWRVLALLNELDSTTAKTIGSISGMHKTKVSRAVAELERRALISRKPNRNDLRESILSLSGAGRALVGEIAPEAQAFSQHLWGTLDGQEQELIETALNKLVMAIEAHPG